MRVFLYFVSWIIRPNVSIILCWRNKFLLLLTLLTSSTWVLSQNILDGTKIVASDRSIDDQFGWSCAIDGEYLAVGATHYDLIVNDTIRDAGAVYIFKKTKAGSWQEVQILTSPSAKNHDWFGTSLSMKGDVLAVAAKGDDDSVFVHTGTYADTKHHWVRMGAVYIYHRTTLGLWELKQKLVANDRHVSEAFGSSISLTSNWLFVGAPDYVTSNPGDVSSSGRVLAFKKMPSSNWEQFQVIRSDQPSKAFGSDLSVDGNNAIIASGGSGKAHFLDSDPSGSWRFVKAVKANPSSHGNVCISNNYAFVTSKGSSVNSFIDVYMKIKTVWQYASTLKSNSQTEDEFGFALAATHSKLVTGAFADNSGDMVNLEYAGAAHIFDLSGDSAITYSGKFMPKIRNRWTKFGFSVSTDGLHVAVGARFDSSDEQDTNIIERAGAVFIYNIKK